MFLWSPVFIIINVAKCNEDKVKTKASNAHQILLCFGVMVVSVSTNI